MSPVQEHIELSRREFLATAASGVGGLAVSSLLQQDGLAAAETGVRNPLKPKPSHFAPKAKACIFIYLAGAPSQIDLFTPKSKLKEMAGQILPDSITKNVRFAFINKSAKVFPSPREFKRYGESGMYWSDRLPHLSACSDDICRIESMHTEAFNHHPGQLLMNCGHQKFGHPSMGSWINYGLGSESENLPGYVVLTAGPAARGGATNWSSGVLPSTYQGILFRNQGEPVLNLNNPAGMTTQGQRKSLDALAELNRLRHDRLGDPEIHSRIAAYELAFRMQMAAPELIDLKKENPQLLEDYGVNRSGVQGSFARNCILARRMVERGVRFINIYHGGWDQHGNLEKALKSNCEVVDQPLAALLRDLKQRGMFDDTLVVWGTEFGRTPLMQGKDGRDHHPFAFTIWMAGGGARRGYVHGESDDIGWGITKDSVHIHDFQATMLNLFGMDDKRLTYRFKGLDFRLTGTGKDEGKVVSELIA
mgnify:CR=1 FL=1